MSSDRGFAAACRSTRVADGVYEKELDDTYWGYNAQFGSGLVLGVEGAISFGARTGQADDSDFYEYAVNQVLDLKFRVGYAFGTGEGSAIVYGFAGLSSMPMNEGYDGHEYDEYGYNLGIGAEFMLTDVLSVGGEFIHRNSLDPYEFDGYENDTGVTLNEFMLRVNYNFN